MKIAIVDDEKFWRDKVVKMVAYHYCNIEIQIDAYASGIKFLDAGKKYDLVLMDIEMPEKDGFDTISEYRKDYVKSIVIILTTHMEISNKGYLVNAFRYVNKDKIEEELEEALCSSEKFAHTDRIITLNVVGLKAVNVVIKDILFIETKKRNVVVHLENKDYECSNSISSLEKELESCGFYRSHKSFLVNLDRIKMFDRKNIYFSGNLIAYVGSHKYAELKTKYAERVIKIASM